MNRKITAVLLAALIPVALFSGCRKNDNSVTTIVAAEDASDSFQSTESTEIATVAEQTTVYEATSAEITSAAETTTATQVTTTEPESSSAPASVIPENTEYDILRSGHFYMVGTITSSDGTVSPVDLAVTDSSMYVGINMEDMNLGAFVDSNNKVFLLSEDAKGYIELSNTLLSFVGIDMTELTSADFDDFSAMPLLNTASAVNDTSVNGTPCKEYVLENSDGSQLNVYLNGTKLLKYITIDESGKIDTISEVTSITSDIPAGKSSIPPDYKKYSGITGMIKLFGKS